MDGGYPAGGSGVLAQLIDDHGEVLVAELLHEYGVDLRDLFHSDSPLSPRYVLNLIKHLPVGGAYNAALRGGPEFRGWDVERYAMAATVDSLRSLQWLYVCAHLGKNRVRPKPPAPYPIPDIEIAKKTAANRPKAGSFADLVVKAKVAASKKKGSVDGRDRQNFHQGFP